MEVQSTLTSTQIGLLAENLVINTLLIESHGRFAPFRPVADDCGIDVLVYDKVSGRAIPLQLKGRTKTLKKAGHEERGDTVHFEVRKVALREKRHTQLLAVLLNEEMTRIETAWLIPLADFELLGTPKPEKIVIRPSRSPMTQDRFSQYRLSKQSSVDRLVDELGAVDGHTESYAGLADS